MRNEAVGEWILRAVTTPDRASALIGDLVQSETSSLRFWIAISSNLLHAITPRVLGVAIIAFLFQFLVSIIPFIIVMYCFTQSVLSMHSWYWCNVASFFCTQLLTGLWIGGARRQRPTLVCLMVVVFDCAVGLVNVNTVSINMAIWSVPVLLGTVFGCRTRRRSYRPGNDARC